MEVEYLLLCHSSARDARQRLSILGIFETLQSTHTPLVITGEVVARILFSQDEQGSRHVFQAEIVNADGVKIIATDAVSFVVQSSLHDLPSAQDFRFDFTGGIVPNFGEYVLQMLLDGKVIKVTPLFAQQMTGM